MFTQIFSCKILESLPMAWYAQGLHALNQCCTFEFSFPCCIILHIYLLYDKILYFFLIYLLGKAIQSKYFECSCMLRTCRTVHFT